MGTSTCNTRVIAVTGSIGSGKSSVLGCFARAGIPCISADLVAREVVAPGSEGLRSIVTTFGSEILENDGSLDRQALAEIVFADRSRLEQLNAITHPLIRAHILALVDELRGRCEPIVALEIPLLNAEAIEQYGVDDVVVVTVDPDLAVQRLVGQRGMSVEEANARLGAQLTDDERRTFARWVIVNDGDLNALEARVGGIVADLKREIFPSDTP